MNNIIKLELDFKSRKNQGRVGAPNIPQTKRVEKSKIKQIADYMMQGKMYFESINIISGCLLEVEYERIVPKSKRVSQIFKSTKVKANEKIAGAKYGIRENGKYHIITYYVSNEDIQTSYEDLVQVSNIIESEYSGIITSEDISQINTNKKKIQFERYGLSKSKFVQYIVDCYYIDKIGVKKELEDDEIVESIVSIYEVNEKIEDIMRKLEIEYDMIDKNTIFLHPEYIEKLKEKAPYLISMCVSDISQIQPLEYKEHTQEEEKEIRSPINEPVVGVIDTLFDESVYFSEWVEARNEMQEVKKVEDIIHGTSVTSLIVDGCNLNPDLDDGCGMFKVRHFGIATHGGIHSAALVKKIEKIVRENQDIKVWNLSLGSVKEIKLNSISLEADILDNLQYKYDVIFVVAGTNKSESETKKIGAPADSINSVVVNSVKRNGEPASYTRVGPVLSFFNKPDISYYGGDVDEGIYVYNGNIKYKTWGTSFAAPWITRKLAYMIHILGFSREIAKALVIDSCIHFEKKIQKYHEMGHGIVPIKIEDVVNSKENEIKLALTATSESYDTYSYALPVLMSDNKYPYIAKATMCYFPKCSRKNGVDYTTSEFNLALGRIKDNGVIDTINNNRQDEEGVYTTEESARNYFRKWDNVKNIIEYFTPNKKEKKSYKNPLWAVSVKAKDRLEDKYSNGVKIGIVVTLREINGRNRFEEYIRQCALMGIIANEVEINNYIDIYNKGQVEIEFE